jgi:5-methylthioribose kinase
MIQFVDVYYKAGAFDKGNKLANRLMQIYQQNVDYYLSLNPEFRANYDEDISEAYGFFNSMKQLTDQYNQKDLSLKVDKFLNERMGVMK